MLNRLMTVRLENPVPVTVTVEPLWATPLTEIRAPIGAETAALLKLLPRLVTWKAPDR